ncbi:MAG: glycosyltransferase family 2 protein, partial [Pleurocapsa sp. CRU_1_2]|nr:glycosyltransferase family 2 protein [Pleurocapsa sp. CRU_1_2]
FYSLWFIWVGLMPLTLAKPAISWLYAPQDRPKLISWTTTKLRALIG